MAGVVSGCQRRLLSLIKRGSPWLASVPARGPMNPLWTVSVSSGGDAEKAVHALVEVADRADFPVRLSASCTRRMSDAPV